MPRRVLASALVLSSMVGCGSAPTTHRGATIRASASSVQPKTKAHTPPTARGTGTPRTGTATPTPLPGCTEADRKQVDADLRALDATIDKMKPGDPHQDPTRKIAALWEHPCMPTLARFFAAPDPRSAAALIDVWKRGLDDAMRASIGGLHVVEGQPPALVVPPEVVPEANAEALAKASAFACAAGDATCARARSYVARAEVAYDARRDVEALRDRSMWCKDPRVIEGATAFESWAVCELSSIPETRRYPSIPLRAPTTGWLVLSGRRGHYSFADEVRAYDLATGAAYVVSSKSALVLGGISVDQAATDAGRVPQTERGEVAADQVRELAFLLGTQALPVWYRESVTTIPVPPDLVFAVERGAGRLGWSRSGWRTSAQTHLAFALIDGKRRTDGQVTWPGAWDYTEDHADDVIRSMEAGLVAGCPRARLPAGIGAGAGKVSPLDASPDAQRDLFGGMEKLLQKLATSPCKIVATGAKHDRSATSARSGP